MLENLVLTQATPTLAVAVIYCLWNRARMHYLRRDKLLRGRVAQLLWAVAHETD